jgi:hypothetical protein
MKSYNQSNPQLPPTDFSAHDFNHYFETIDSPLPSSMAANGTAFTSEMNRLKSPSVGSRTPTLTSPQSVGIAPCARNSFRHLTPAEPLTLSRMLIFASRTIDSNDFAFSARSNAVSLMRMASVHHLRPWLQPATWSPTPRTQTTIRTGRLVLSESPTWKQFHQGQAAQTGDLQRRQGCYHVGRKS